MKHFNKLLIAAFLILGLASCKKDDNDDVQPVSLTVKLSFDAANTAYGFSYEKTAVKITNLTTNQTYSTTAAADGTATFSSIAPGNYDISSTLSIAAADFNAVAGTNVQDAVFYNGSLSRQTVVANSQLAVTLQTSRVGDFVIKQIYYAGSSAANGAIFRDQFFEIYNNSNATLYADSLYVAQVIGNNTAATRVDLTKAYFQSSGQYDWAKSVNMSATNPNTAYIYAKTVFMIPGTGKQYPVEPGKSIIIAATALNHQSPYIGTDGKSVTVKDPSLTIDLSKADFEVYLGDQSNINPLASDIDNPSVTNVKVIDNNTNRDLILDNLGRDGLVIFKTLADVKTWPKFATPDETQITIDTKLYIQVPVQYIIDGVSLQQTVVASRIAKRLPDVLDAGETYVPAGSYSSQSVVRKTSKTVGGRVVLKDTNNSTADFGYLSKSDASKSATSFVN
jgi:hypothetical protein